jgi:hypothetical protein
MFKYYLIVHVVEISGNCEGVGKILCLCGKNEDNPYCEWVQCDVCGLWQHSLCVGYDDDLDKDTFYSCTQCVALGHKIKVKTTLIVSPSSIMEQWKSEIDLHTLPGSLKVMTYLGE